MTENEAKGFIQGKVDCMKKCDVFECKGTDECDSCNYCYSQGTFGEQKKAFEMAIQALEEVQAYRAIGLTPSMVEDLIKSCKKHEKNALENAHIVDDYREIGTIEELQALKEKNEPKKIVRKTFSDWTYDYDELYCPTCDNNIQFNDGSHCQYCGQVLDRQ